MVISRSSRCTPGKKKGAVEHKLGTSDEGPH